MDQVKVAVVGVGHLGSLHARIYSELEGVRLVGVMDSSYPRAEEIARRYGCRPFSAISRLPEDVEAVSVVVPTPQHYEVARELLERGCHLLVEKPFTQDIIQAKELLRLAQRNKLQVQVGHVERFNPAILAAKKVIKEPRFIECHRQAPFQPRGTEVGVVLDLMIHDLDIILHLVGSPVVELEAVGAAVLSLNEDIANARLKFKNGAIANVTASRISPEKMRKIRIFQDDAYISLNYITQQSWVYRKERDRIVSELLPSTRGEPLRLELQSFIESVRLGGVPQVPGQHGLEALRVALDIIREVEKSERKLKKLQDKTREEWSAEIGEALPEEVGEDDETRSSISTKLQIPNNK